MAQSIGTNQNKTQDVSLTDWLATLCRDEQQHLTRAPSKEPIKARVISADEKIRTAGARTAGG